MPISEDFFSSKYDDAPWLSDQLLLPNLARGYAVHMLSAFAPSYLFKLVADLAASEEVEPGYLNVIFFVPGDLSIRSQSIARFKTYLEKYSNDWEVAKFVSNCLQIIKEGRENNFGGMQIQVLHTNQKRPLTKSLTGVIVDPEEPDNYATFVDAKGGDFNSPVQIRKSWIADERYEAQDVLGHVVKAHSSTSTRNSLVSATEVEEWLIYLQNFFEANPPLNPEANEAEEQGQTVEGDAPVSAPQPDEGDTDTEFLKHLKGLDEFDDEEQYGWYEDEDDWDLGPVNYSVEGVRTLYGHVPPLEGYAAMMLGGESAISRCVCGEKFTRIYGCSRVMWDSRDIDQEPDIWD